MQIVEHAFKSSSQELRKSGYLCWRVLIDNFALDPQVLSSSKRIKLITRPLVVSQVNYNWIGNNTNTQIYTYASVMKTYYVILLGSYWQQIRRTNCSKIWHMVVLHLPIKRKIVWSHRHRSNTLFNILLQVRENYT